MNLTQNSAREAPKTRRFRRNVLLCFLAVSAIAVLLIPFPESNSALKVKTKLTIDGMKLVESALVVFRTHCGRYPTNEEGLGLLLHDTDIANWRGPYLSDTGTGGADAWGKPVSYRIGKTGVIFLNSNGPDRLPDTEDDIQLKTDLISSE